MAAVTTPTARAERVLGVIVPAFNEGRTIERVVRRVLEQPCVQQVVIVDDGSTDGTLAEARRLTSDSRVTVKHHEANRGKGAGIRTGLDAIDAPLVIVQDADLEYDPADYERLIAPILRGRADVVFGTRGFAGHSAYSYWFVVGNRLVTTATNMLFNCYIQDMETGFKVMRTSLMRRLGLRGDRFDVEPQITGRILRLGYRIYEIPIEYAARTREQGKKLTWRDGVKALFVLVRVRFSTRASLFGRPDPYHRRRLEELNAALMGGGTGDVLAHLRDE
ncbi:MAG TPA: glycosyltransferase family 2 protein [Candidatus Dormibacteraeota bacterium]|nr:glycosyltransferase family 2 protein [Candidatus Dormibacteraeota bacterium]